jgi:hypothetical protein
MRKIDLLAIAALMLAGVVVWVASTTPARVAAPIAAGGIDPSQISINARDLPIEEFVDYSFVFN